ncbi:probable glutamate receptor [Dermacentor silvarum]|uniref:probable glutamate receptor n=1 Tax=Dermacentor silvarum TaxID=543639 RepID=UPI002101309A|nr:probable glutamate receptor [Dermacentor silvarum]
MAVNATHLRVTVAASPPWVQVHDENGKLYVTGIFGHLLRALADFVPFSFDVTYDPKRSFGTRLGNGTYTGIIGLLQTGEADLAASPVFLRSDRSEVVKFAPVIYTSHCALIAVAGEPSVNAFGYLFVFDWQAWAIIIASVPLMSAALALIEKRRPRSGNTFALEAYDNIWDILSSFAYKGHTANTESYAGRLLLSFWWLIVLVLTNEFAGHLMASIAIKSEPPRFRSVADVAYQTSIRPLIWRDTAFDAYVRTSPRESLRSLTRLAQRKNGFVPLSELYSEASLEQLYSGRAVLINDRDGSMHILAKRCRVTGGRLYVAPEFLFTTFSTIAYSKQFPADLEERIQAKMRAIMESGLRLEWYDEGVKEWHRCRDMQRSGASKAGVLSFEELSYDDMAAIFLLWTIMVAFSLVVFLLEICFHKMGTQHYCRFQRIKPTWNGRRLHNGSFQRSVGREEQIGMAQPAASNTIHEVTEAIISVSARRKLVDFSLTPAAKD